MSQENYYIPPTQEIFDEIKQACISVWSTMDDTYGYATDKTNCIKDLKNVQDNAMYMFAMFDIINQAKVFQQLSFASKEFIYSRSNL